MFAFNNGKTIIVKEFLVLGWGHTSLSGLFVVEARNRFVVESRVHKDWDDGLSRCSTGDPSASELEILGLFSERRVSLAGRRGFACLKLS